MSPRPFKHFSPKEKDLLRRWLASGKTRAEAARLLGGDLSTVVRQAKLLKRRGPPPTKGRPKKICAKLAAALAKKAQLLTKAADAKYQVTAEMIKKGAGLKCSTRLVLDALHSEGLYLHPLREKPVRTEADEQGRLQFAQDYGKKPWSFWQQRIHAYLDNKAFPVYLSPKARAYAFEYLVSKIVCFATLLNTGFRKSYVLQRF